MLPAVVAMVSLLLPAAVAQQSSPNYSGGVTIQGVVLSSDGKPASDAVVSLERNSSPGAMETKTDAAGAFKFSSLATGSYRLSAGRSGSRSRTTDVTAASENDIEKVDLVLAGSGLASNTDASSASGAQAMQFADQPNFTIAGVTDWTAVGGHGSDSTLRTSEALTSETAALKPDGASRDGAGAPGDIGEEKESESVLRTALARTPNSFDSNHRLGKLYLRAGQYPEAIPLLENAYRIDPANDLNGYDLALAYEGAGDLSRARTRIRELLANQQSADLHRLAGEVEEKSGDPFSAVHEYEQAVKLDPSEPNYFAWGSELLLHRAVLQAQVIFHKAAEAYPKSARMQTALGTALFAGASYEEAALRLCDASDLDPSNPGPYLFMGKIQMASPNSLYALSQDWRGLLSKSPEAL